MKSVQLTRVLHGFINTYTRKTGLATRVSPDHTLAAGGRAPAVAVGHESHDRIIAYLGCVLHAIIQHCEMVLRTELLVQVLLLGDGLEIGRVRENVLGID